MLKERRPDFLQGPGSAFTQTVDLLVTTPAMRVRLTLAPCRLAPSRLAPERFAPRKLSPCRSAPRRSRCARSQPARSGFVAATVQSLEWAISESVEELPHALNPRPANNKNAKPHCLFIRHSFPFIGGRRVPTRIRSDIPTYCAKTFSPATNPLSRHVQRRVTFRTPSLAICARERFSILGPKQPLEVNCSVA